MGEAEHAERLLDHALALGLVCVPHGQGSREVKGLQNGEGPDERVLLLHIGGVVAKILSAWLAIDVDGALKPLLARVFLAIGQKVEHGGLAAP